MSDREYTIKPAPSRPSLAGRWDEEAWKGANVLTLDHWVAASSDHHPRVEVKVTYQYEGVFLFYRVRDKYVRCVHTEYQSNVCRDSCVEFFVEPKPGRGYFNFEINCGGTMLLYYIEDPTIVDGEFRRREDVPWEVGERVQIHHSLPSTVEPEIEGDTDWVVEYFVPFALFETFVGPLAPVAGRTWRANFYKCADGCSHPHWASWAPLHGEVSFHVPQHFAPIRFE